MLKRPIVQFLIALTLFFLVFGGLNSNALRLPHRVDNWLALVCLLASLLFALSAMIKGIMLIRKKKSKSFYNLIAIIGGTFITVLLVIWVILVLMQS
jgi:hypothetical protein